MIKLMVHPQDVDESILIQKAAFAAGYQWGSKDQSPRLHPLHWITVRPEEKTIKFSSKAQFPKMKSFTEKTVAEILRMLGDGLGIDCTIPEGT